MNVIVNKNKYINDHLVKEHSFCEVLNITIA